MNYEKHYNLLVDRAKNRKLEGYSEKHHILPKCIGGGNEEANLVALTAEEHFFAHELLVKIYPENQNLIYAVHRMCSKSASNSGRVNRKLYGWLRKKHAEVHSAYMKEWNRLNPHVVTDVTRQKISATLMGRTLPKATGQKMSISRTGVMRGPYKKSVTRKKPNQISDNQREKMAIRCVKVNSTKDYQEIGRKCSESKRNKPTIMGVCPSCGAEGNLNTSAFKQWHFNNCRVIKEKVS